MSIYEILMFQLDCNKEKEGTSIGKIREYSDFAYIKIT